MFAPTYFPASYFAPTYFPGGSAPTVAADLLEAIYLAFVAVGLGSTFPGGLWLDRAPNGTEFPFATYSVASDVDEFDTSDTHQRQYQIQFSAYHTGKESARLARKALRAAMLPAAADWVPLEWTGGLEIGRFPGGQTLNLDPDRGPGGVDVWQATFDVLFFCEESYGSGS